MDGFWMGASKAKGDLRVTGAQGDIAQSAQHVLDQRENFRFVVDDEDRFGRPGNSRKHTDAS
jgi:hypothetical protein